MASAAPHGVVVPMQCEYFALEGLSDLVNTIRQVHANLNPDLQGHRPAARDVRCAHHTPAASERATPRATSARRCSTRSFRATCGSPRRQATGVPGVVFGTPAQGCAGLHRVRPRDGSARGSHGRSADRSNTSVNTGFDPTTLCPALRMQGSTPAPHPSSDGSMAGLSASLLARPSALVASTLSRRGGCQSSRNSESVSWLYDSVGLEL